MSEDKLNRFEKEKKVIELYKEGRTIREISPIVHMAFRDIGKLIKKYLEDTDENKKLRKQISIKALTLFNEGKKPIEVAISLELDCEQTEKIYQEYWRLNNLHILYSIYQELKAKISDLIDVYYKFKGEKRTSEEIIKLIEILQEISNLEDYKKILEEKIGNYERQYRGVI
ncbi:MAG TPA: hypothetical protein VFK40_15020 [Nitrososphaeraceae archaeon]|nr:hypothetical protein [Nitrososphaeraceae archaeon]